MHTTILSISLLFLPLLLHAILLPSCYNNSDLSNYSQPCCPTNPIGSYYLHIPKTGGTSTRVLLEKFLLAHPKFNPCDLHNSMRIVGGQQAYGCDVGRQEEIYQKIYVERYLHECHFIAGHFDVTMLNRLPFYDKRSGKKQIVDVVSMRDPVKRALSRLGHYLWKTEELDQINNASRKEQFLELVRTFGNQQTQYLSGHSGCFLSRGQHRRMRFNKTWDQYWDDLVVEAQTNLKSFCVFILIDKPRCGLMQLGRQFGVKPPRLESRNIGSITAYPKYLRVAAFEATKYDRQLYEYAKELNELNCQRLGLT